MKQEKPGIVPLNQLWYSINKVNWSNLVNFFPKIQKRYVGLSSTVLSELGYSINKEFCFKTVLRSTELHNTEFGGVYYKSWLMVNDTLVSSCGYSDSMESLSVCLSISLFFCNPLTIKSQAVNRSTIPLVTILGVVLVTERCY